MMLILKDLRTSRNISQQVVADYLEISRQAYSNYETGARTPDYETLLKLGEFFSVSVDELLTGKKPTVGMDDFTYAMHNHSGDLTEDDKAMLLKLAGQLAEANKRREDDGS